MGAVRGTNRQEYDIEKYVPISVYIISPLNLYVLNTCQIADLQMTYAPAAWARQRASWRAVIQLNLIHSINLILDILTSVASTASAASFHHTNHNHSHTNAFDEEQTFSSQASVHGGAIPLTEKHTLLKLRLAPLRRVEADLRKHLGMAFSSYTDEDAEGEGVNGAISMDAEQWATPFDPPTRPTEKENRRKVNEFFVRVRRGMPGSSKDGSCVTKDGRPTVADEAMEVLMGCAEDMKTLWEDKTVRGVLEGWGIRLSQWSGL